MNAERCLLAGEALGLGYVALEKASKYAQERIVFGRPIGRNQGIQHPLAAAYMNLEAAKLATYHAARMYDARGRDANITPHAVGVACNSAKYLAAEAAFTACERSVSGHCRFRGDKLTPPGVGSRRDGICTGVPCREVFERVLCPSYSTSEQSKWDVASRDVVLADSS